jgi:hypothetical protein
MALTGSLMWELFGEAKPPSTNDLLSTTLGGVAIGEPLQRLSMIMLDEESTGLDRLGGSSRCSSPTRVLASIVSPGDRAGRDGRIRRCTVPTRCAAAPPSAPASSGPSDASTMGTPVLSFALDYGDPFREGRADAVLLVQRQHGADDLESRRARNPECSRPALGVRR